jgi:hypothetical protein
MPISAGFMGSEGTHFSLAGKSYGVGTCGSGTDRKRPTMNAQPDSVWRGYCLDFVAHIVQWLPQLRTIAV